MSDYSSTYPTQSPTFAFDAKAGKLDSRISYTRSSTGTAFSSEKHLSSLNLLTNSEDFTAWTKTAYVSVSANAATAPDGNTTADKITVTSTSNYPWTYQSTGSTSGASDTIIFSVYLKMDGWRYALLSPSNTTGDGVWFDLQSGTVGTESAGSTGTITAIGSSGWYRCSVSRTASMTVQGLVALVDADNSQTGTAGGTNGVLAWGGQLTDQFSGVTTYNATTTQISREFAPTLKTSQSDQPRFEFSATDGQSEGLLIEAQASNLFTYSHELNQWTSARSTIDQNSAIGPTGELTADTLRIDSTDADSHYIYQQPSVASGTAYTSSAYVKPAGLTHFAVRFQTAFTDSLVIFNAATGAVTSNAQSLSTSATSVGNGWFRLSATATATSTTSASMTMYGCDSDSTVNVATGDNYRGLLITGLQFEASSAPSSLISTSGAAATKSADSCSVATSSFYTGGPVSVVSETSGGYGSFPGCWVIKNSTGSEALQLYKQSAAATEATDFRVYANSGGINTVDTLITSSASAGKMAVSYGTNDVAFTASGNAVQTDTSASSIGAVESLIIGGITTTNQLNGHVQRLALYNVALSDTELQAITS